MTCACKETSGKNKAKDTRSKNRILPCRILINILKLFAAADQVITILVANALVPGHVTPLDIADMSDVL